jgi:hypothetical protein
VLADPERRGMRPLNAADRAGSLGPGHAYRWPGIPLAAGTGVDCRRDKEKECGRRNDRRAELLHPREQTTAALTRGAIQAKTAVNKVRV